MSSETLNSNTVLNIEAILIKNYTDVIKTFAAKKKKKLK